MAFAAPSKKLLLLDVAEGETLMLSLGEPLLLSLGEPLLLAEVLPHADTLALAPLTLADGETASAREPLLLSVAETETAREPLLLTVAVAETLLLTLALGEILRASGVATMLSLG